MTSILIASLLCALPPRGTPPPPADQSPQQPLSDEEVRERIDTFMGTIDTRISPEQWRALGTRGAAILEGMAQDPNLLPTRRAKAVAGLSAIGAETSSGVLLSLARSPQAPLNVRLTAVHGVPGVVAASQLRRPSSHCWRVPTTSTSARRRPRSSAATGAVGWCAPRRSANATLCPCSGPCRAATSSDVIPRALREAVRRAAGSGGVAAFDADGTLWREDVGEAFLRHLVAIGWVRLPDGSDPYEAYERAVDRDKRTGYAYAAQLQEGLLAAEVAAEAERFARSWVPRRLVRAALELRAACVESGLRTVVISASPLPIVRAAAPLAGIAEHAAIEVRIQAGRFTREVLEPIPYAEGKVAAATLFGPLIVACGDSLPGEK